MNQLLTLITAIALSAIAAAAQTNVLSPIPVMSTPPTTMMVSTTTYVVGTNTTITTNAVVTSAPVIYTNASLTRFIIDIGTNSAPTRFVSVMSNGGVIVTPAGSVAALTNSATLSMFYETLQSIVAAGTPVVTYATNAFWSPRAPMR